MIAGFEVGEIVALTLSRPNRLADMYTLSPFVWRDGSSFHMLLRAVPRRDDEPRLKIAEIWHGLSTDGLHFEMDQAPVVFPGPDLVDCDGCEDPTVLVDADQLRVWYSGWNQQQETGRLLLARGPDVNRLTKAGVVMDSRPPFANPKEASIVVAPEGWRLFFEYAEDGTSLIGSTTTTDLDGPWGDPMPSPLQPRADSWDDWHMSPGPFVHATTDCPVMFYNGATSEPKWRIGWAAFDSDLTRVIARSADPLIEPAPRHDGLSDIAFAASAVECGKEIWLYLSFSDQDLRRAVLKAQ